MNNILVVVAHPDDEALGAGGTIKRHIQCGDSVSVISLTDGVAARKTSTVREKNERSAAASSAAEILGFSWAQMCDFKDNALDSYSLLEVVQCVEEIKTKIRPTMVYTHSGADLNIDHRIVLNAVLTAFRPQPGEDCREIRLFEVPSATDFGNDAVTGRFSPNLYVDISETWPAKELALKAYQAEMRIYPHARSIEAVHNLSKYRGSQIGVEKAEAFQIIRKIER